MHIKFLSARKIKFLVTRGMPVPLWPSETTERVWPDWTRNETVNCKPSPAVLTWESWLQTPAGPMASSRDFHSLQWVGAGHVLHTKHTWQRLPGSWAHWKAQNLWGREREMRDIILWSSSKGLKSAGPGPLWRPHVHLQQCSPHCFLKNFESLSYRRRTLTKTWWLWVPEYIKGAAWCDTWERRVVIAPDSNKARRRSLNLSQPQFPRQ